MSINSPGKRSRGVYINHPLGVQVIESSHIGKKFGSSWFDLDLTNSDDLKTRKNDMLPMLLSFEVPNSIVPQTGLPVRGSYSF